MTIMMCVTLVTIRSSRTGGSVVNNAPGIARLILRFSGLSNKTLNGGPISIWPCCWWNVKPEFTHSLTHSRFAASVLAKLYFQTDNWILWFQPSRHLTSFERRCDVMTSFHMTSYEHQCDVMTSHRRQHDVISTSCAHCERVRT